MKRKSGERKFTTWTIRPTRDAPPVTVQVYTGTKDYGSTHYFCVYLENAEVVSHRDVNELRNMVEARLKEMSTMTWAKKIHVGMSDAVFGVTRYGSNTVSARIEVDFCVIWEGTDAQGKVTLLGEDRERSFHKDHDGIIIDWTQARVDGLTKICSAVDELHKRLRELIQNDGGKALEQLPVRRLLAGHSEEESE